MTPRQGALAALLAAVAFGSSSPLVKRFLGDVPALTLAGLLYLGAGGAMYVVRAVRSVPREAPLRGKDYLWLASGIPRRPPRLCC